MQQKIKNAIAIALIVAAVLAMMFSDTSLLFAVIAIALLAWAASTDSKHKQETDKEMKSPHPTQLNHK